MTKTFNSVEFNGTTFVLKGSERTFKNWEAPSIPNNNSYTIYLYSSEAGEKKATRFDFWCSLAHPVLTDEGLCNAFNCFVSDALAGDMDFEMFMAEFGYDWKKIKEAKKIWQACKESLKKLQSIYKGDIYDLANFLKEQEEEDWPDFYHNKNNKEESK